MRSTIRSLVLSAAALLALTAQAQPTYMWVVSGTVPNCTPNQVVTLQTIQGTIPQQTLTATLDSNCNYFAVLYVASTPAWIQASTPCNGQIVQAWDSAVFNSFIDTAYTVIDLNCGGMVDCLGVPGGNALPGTPCNDGDPMTINDTWDANCTCAGVQQPNCQADFTVQQTAPWQIATTDLSMGTPPLTYDWWLPDGSSSTLAEPGFTFTQSGVYGICLTVTDANNCSSWMCDTLVVDSSGMLNNNPIWYDCLGVLWGPDVPGSPCDDGDPMTMNDTWNNNCVCSGTAGTNSLFVTGTIAGCTGSALVQVQDWWTQPNLDTTFTTDPNCGYLFSYEPTSPQFGWVTISYSCDNGLTWNTDSVFYSFTGAFTIQQNGNCQGGLLDCLGTPGGTALPGTPCNDGDPMTVNDTWDANCNCVGVPQSNCQAAFTVQQNAPWQIATTDLSTGTPPITYSWWLPDGSNSTLAEPTYTFSQAGIYGICLTITADSGFCTSTMCDTIVVDSNGMINTGTIWYDCLGVLWGPDVPGAPCNDGDSLTVQDTWSMNCVCVGVPLNAYDCLGILNGPNMPGTPCDDGNPATTNDMWDANCDCVGSVNAPCQADFWVIQAYTVDSLLGPMPIPNELWLWNLSSGGSGTYSYLWDFGDGSSSTDPFPTHNYAGSGPYVLCLTIDDGLNCISTHCDTVAIDSNGIYTGMVVFGNGVRSSTGFTLNVQNPGANGLEETLFVGEPSVWPNPVNDQLNVAFELQQAGRTEIMVLDMQGRVLMNEAGNFGSGASLLRLPTATLSPGLYTLRLSNGTATTAVRFVKVD